MRFSTFKYYRMTVKFFPSYSLEIRALGCRDSIYNIWLLCSLPLTICIYMQHDMLGLALLRMAILVCSSSFRNAEIQMNNLINMQHDMLGFALLHIAILVCSGSFRKQSVGNRHTFLFCFTYFFIFSHYILNFPCRT